MTPLLSLLLALLLPLIGWLSTAAPAAAAIAEHYRCGEDPLVAEVHAGAVDAPGIPNAAAGTVPGDFIVLRWRGVSLQLPRTNNAGPPSFTDGQWWWSLEDPDHPDLRLRRTRGDVLSFSCERQP